MSEEPEAGQVYVTEDGKTVFMDPKTNQLTVFDGTTETPPQEVVKTEDFTFPYAVINTLFGNKVLISPVAIIPYTAKEALAKPIDPLGDDEFYVLVPLGIKLNNFPISIGAWVIEKEKGYKPNYIEHSKHRILAEQFDYLNKHKDCEAIVVWLDEKCPVYPAVACQKHATCMIPVAGTDKTILQNSDVFLESSKINIRDEVIWGEEREI